MAKVPAGSPADREFVKIPAQMRPKNLAWLLLPKAAAARARMVANTSRNVSAKSAAAECRDFALGMRLLCGILVYGAGVSLVCRKCCCQRVKRRRIGCWRFGFLRF